jgi:hypothetical protein
MGEMRLRRRCPQSRVDADEEQAKPWAEQIGHDCAPKGLQLLAGESGHEASAWQVRGYPQIRAPGCRGDRPIATLTGMPKSRTRHQAKPIRTHPRARIRVRAEHRVRPDGVEPMRWRAVLAEARGDAATASRLLSECAGEDDDLHRADLTAMVRHADHAPPWLVARWITRQALRWVRLRRDERYSRSLYLCLRATYWSRSELTVADLPPPYAAALANDWVTRELVLYGHRVLDEFLDHVAERRLIDAAGSIRSWTRMPLRPYQLVDGDDDSLVVSDLVTGCGHEVFDLGTGGFYPLGSEVLGRLVPVGDELWMFEALPLLIDRRTAVDLASALPPHHSNPLPWAPLLTRAIDQGRLPRLLGVGLRTPVIDDFPVLGLPDGEWEPRDDERWPRRTESTGERRW